MDHLPLFFLTDFGTKDAWVGIMKAQAYRIGVRSLLLDITHGIPPQDILTGAIQLEAAICYLPDECVVCAVVDPGVGTTRRAIAAKMGNRYFVAPDNGLLNPVFETGDYQLREISAGGPIKPNASATFHGRDVFAPAAALLASKQRAFEDLGPKAFFPARLQYPPVRTLSDGSIELSILCIDHFGNLTTNLCRDSAPSGVDFRFGKFMLGNRDLGPRCTTFEDVAEGAPVVYFNSSNRLEIGISHGNAAQHFGVGRGTSVIFRPKTD